MKTYYPSASSADLTNLPPFEESAGYRVIEGQPRASIRFDRGAENTTHRLGVWKCTPGTFQCVEKGDELQTILRGRLRLTYEDGATHEFGPGDSFFTEKGEKVIWSIIETVEKVFFTYDASM